MKKKIIIIGTLAILLGLTVIVKPKEKEEYKDITKYNNKLALFVENEEGIYEEAQTIPTSGYTLNESKSACSNNAKPSWNISDNTLKISSLEQSSTSCYLYFRKANSVDKILANSKINEGTPDFGTVATTDEGMFKAEDDDGTSYYYRGAVENNYVKFANKYWRIIRINGDGSIRLIYQGTSATSTGTDAQIGTSAFNTSYDDNMYVGFKYTNGEVHGIGTESKILQKLNTWYTTNLSSYADKIDTNVGFCGDRTPSTSSSTINNSVGTVTTTTYYGGYIRLVNSTKSPSLTCPTDDFYTVARASKGNKSLTYPIGLITADEAAMAGGVYSVDNQSYYLYNGQIYWTLSPCIFSSGGSAHVFVVGSDGYFNDYSVTSAYGVRPVINLRSDIELTGIGTMSDPYVVVGGN